GVRVEGDLPAVDRRVREGAVAVVNQLVGQAVGQCRQLVDGRLNVGCRQHSRLGVVEGDGVRVGVDGGYRVARRVEEGVYPVDLCYRGGVRVEGDLPAVDRRVREGAVAVVNQLVGQAVGQCRQLVDGRLNVGCRQHSRLGVVEGDGRGTKINSLFNTQ